MEDPQSPSNIPHGETSTSNTTTGGSKPIKKKVPVFETEDMSGAESPDEDSPPFSPPSTRELEGKARRELVAYLESKQLDPKYADMFQVHIGIQKKRKSLPSAGSHSRKSDGPGYSVTYSSSDGSILTSRGDVLNAITELKQRTARVQHKSGGNSGTVYALKRSDAFVQAKQRLHETLPQLPVNIDGITVHSFGHLDPRSGFETIVQLYPIGYKCEQTVRCVNFFKGPSEQRVVCEVGELEGYPEFRITVKNNGDTFIASTESAAWKKFNPANVEAEWQPSFFNLQVELLLEGLQGADTCDTYRFHVERGYGSQYYEQEEAVLAKAAYLAKSGREKRNQERQKARLLSKEEVERLQELENKKLADEKELAKKLALVEKERKDHEREVLKRSKQEQRLLDQSRRDEERAEETRRKEANKTVEKAQREQSKKNERFRAQFKKEINAELRKNRSEANSALLQYFDDEEEVFEQNELAFSGSSPATAAALSTSSAGLREFLASLSDAPITPAAAAAGQAISGTSTGTSTGTSWDDLIRLTNTLHLFKRHLNLESAIRLDGVASSLDLVARAPALRRPASTVTSTAADASVSAMDVEPSETPATAAVKNESKDAQDDSDAEFNEEHTRTAVIPNTGAVIGHPEEPAELTEEARLAQAEAELDRIQLKMMKHLLRELRDVLDIADPNTAEAAPATTTGKSKSAAGKSTATRLPLNQLTWAELARMSILNHLYQEQGHERENIQHVLRGAKAPHFRLAKNVIRNIRYRIAVQTKLPASVEHESLVAQAVSCGGCESALCAASGTPLCFLGTQVSRENRLACMSAVQSAKEKNTKPQKGIELATLTSYQRRITYQNNLFSSEKEIIQSLEQVCTSNGADSGASALPHATYSDTYKRCCRVLARLLNVTASRNLIWEVDASLYPDYYTVIARPVMYTSIAAALLNKQYSFTDTASTGTDEDTLVSALFAADLMQVPINCIVYNTEITPVVAQAYKILHASHRMLQTWMYAPTRPALSMMTETFCLLTQEYIVGTDALKCGKCTGFYCWSALEDACSDSQGGRSTKAGAEYAPYYVSPTQEIVDQANEEWVCPLCLSEDSQLLQKGLAPTSLAALYGTPYSVDEWGPSSKVPWLLNSAHSTLRGSFASEMPYLSPFITALEVLGQTHSTAVLPVMPGATHILNPALTRGPKQHAPVKTVPRNTAPEVTTWSFAERVSVLLALAVVFRSTDRSLDFMQSINADCEKLLKISAKPNFREADFMSAVKDLLGEEGVVQCRSLLDGLDGQASDAYLQQVVTEGRCVVCKHSTFEEDMQEKAQARGDNNDEEGGDGSKEDEVILCDGCNAEVHLRCLNLTAVPTSEWHCNICRDRLALRESKHSALTQFEGSSSIEKHRNKAEEEVLLNTIIDKRISAVSTTGRLKESAKDKDRGESANGSNASLAAMEPAPGEDKCVYCGLGELELCSPFVVGQSRAEHEAVLKLGASKPTADGFFDSSTTGTKGKTLSAPAVEFPYFPPVNTAKGEALLAAQRDARGGPLVAHQLCALQVFQARITRSRHTLRRKNKVVGERAVTMTGISVQPLGYDNSGREYWKFPVSDDLFVCTAPLQDECEGEFRAYVERLRRESEGDFDAMDVDNGAVHGAVRGKSAAAVSARADKKWKRISEVGDIRRVVELLDASPAEQALRTNIVNALLLERVAPATTTATAAAASQSSVPDATSAVDTKSEADTDTKSAAVSADAGTLNSWIDRSRSSGSLERNASVEDLKPKKPVVDIVPVGMRLITAKGQDIMPSYVIQEEAVFEEEAVESDAEEGDDEEADAPVNEYFTFNKGRKYYAIALVNKEDSILKMGGTAKVQGLTVVYQIHREGIAAPLSYAPLSEAWSDHMYYFATVSFKKSGRYTLSFITEGENAGSIKPLIYPVVVEARTVRCGIPHALDRLYATQYLDAVGRAVLIGRREVVTAIEQTYNDADAVRAALLMVYLALPSGALVQDLAADGVTAAKGNTFALITEPAGWNDVLDQAWRGAVFQATTPVQLMECALLLEHYVSKQWLLSPQSRLLSSLPNPHFALTSATYSAVALRVYCLDKALMYDKVVAAPRERRSTGNTFDAYAYEEPARGAAPINTISGRSKRPAAQQASARIKSSNYEDSDDEDADDDAKASGPPAAQQPQKWDCAECTIRNEARARSCSACGARKPVVSLAAAQDSRGNRPSSRTGRGESSRGDRRQSRESRQQRSKKRDADSEEEDESEDGDDSSNSDESGDNSLNGSDDGLQDTGSEAEEAKGRASTRRRANSNSRDAVPERKSGRARPVVSSYFATSEDSEEEDEEVGTSSSKRRREDSQGGTSGPNSVTKRTKVMTDEEYYAQYKSQIPARVAEFSTEIAALGEKLQSDTSSADAKTTVDFQMRCLSVLRVLMGDARTEPFWNPVDPKLVPSYKHYVKEPMDLGTIGERVRSGRYGNSADAFMKDVRLVWSNCKAFNLEGSLLSHYAGLLGATCEDLYARWFTAADRPRNPDLTQQK